MLSTELEAAIRRALDDATRRGHEFSALEHLLLALLADEKTAEVIRHCGGPCPGSGQAGDVPGEEIAAARGGPRARPADVGLRTRHPARRQPRARRGEKQANGANVLVAMFSEPESQRSLLQGRGHHRLDMVELHLARHLEAVASQDERRGRRGRSRSRADEEGEEAPADPLAAFAVNLNERARGGRNRSADRPRPRDRARAARAGAAAQEQPAVRGRCGRRQDGHRRGAGPAHRAGRGARALRARRSTRSTWARWWPARATAATSRSGSRP